MTDKNWELWELDDIFYKIKPELKDKDSLSGMKVIEDMGFDSVEVVMLMAELEEYVGIPIERVGKVEANTSQYYTYVDSGLESGKVYYYKIRCRSAYGTTYQYGDYSNKVSFRAS